jgi:hypothetical protein
MSRFIGLIWALPLVLFAWTLPGCIVEESAPPPPPPPDTEIGFDPVTNFGEACGGQLTSWQATDRNDSWAQTASCNEQIVFTGLTPGASYSFDILGYSGNELCWQGACSVGTEQGILTFGDCSKRITYLCAGHP